MSHSFEGTTLALQHYYDIVGTYRKLPLLTVYQANEQPFGNRVLVWMAAYGDDIKVAEDTAKRLDDAMLKNRAIAEPHVLRVLDYGTSEGFSFVVTDAIRAITLRAWLRAHGPLDTWQALRLLDQLTGIITTAHQSNFENLCLDSDNIFIINEDRFEIVTGPLGIGLHRNEILTIKDIPISAEFMRHIPPWEYAKHKITLSSDQVPQATDSAPKEDSSPKTDESISEPSNPPPSEQETDLSLNDDSIQDLLLQPELEDSTPKSESLALIPPPDGLCPDIYNLAVVMYESLCGQHPFFSEDRDLCDAAFSIFQATPLPLSKRIEINDELNDVVMEKLQSPQKGTEAEFLTRFSACCSDADREKARQAEKTWLSPAPTQSSEKRKKKSHVKFKHPYAIAGIGAAIVLLLTIFITYKLAQYHEPVDLFAIPELIPANPQGVDVVISPHVLPPNTSIWLTSLADGSLIKLGSLPYIYRQQEPGAKLNFVISDESGHSMQVPVTVKGDQGLMMVPVELNW